MACRSQFDVHEQDKSWPNWSGDVRFVASKYWEPEHSAPGVHDGLPRLVDVVARATDEDQSLHAIGSGWAFEDLAASDDWVISLKNLDHQLEYVVGAGTDKGLTQAWHDALPPAKQGYRLVHVEAGIRIATLCERLEAAGLAMPTLGGANGQALAGVISTSTHGGDWEQQPFPDLVRAIHLVTDGGEEKWIERESAPITADDAALEAALPCPDTELIRDDRVFDAALVACGRFGIIYSVVLEVRPSFRVVEATTTPGRAEVLQALRDGVTNGTLFQPVFDLLAPAALPAGIGVDGFGGVPYFLEIVFNSQRPDDVWVTRRFETTIAMDLPVPLAPPAVGTVTATSSDHDLAVNILEAANAALAAAALAAVGVPVAGVFSAAYITGVAVAMNVEVASRPFSLGSVVSAALNALWRVQLGGLIPDLNFKVIDGMRFRPRIDAGRRGPHYLLTSGTRAESDSESYKAASIEVVFDATTTDYLDFLQLVMAPAPTFRQAGYISLRPSRASSALLSMHNVSGSHAMSIEISSLGGLSGNLDWMRFVHALAVAHGGRPHWGQFNKLDSVDVSMLYGSALNEWQEALLQVSGTSTRFSNAFSRARGLEPRGILRQVTAVRKGGDDDVTHLCNPNAAWSPVTVAQAIREIESGTVQYFVHAADRVVPVLVVDGRYLRSQADDTEKNNLDKLPLG